MTPISSPRESLYSETGLLDAEHIEAKERINQLQRMNSDKSSLLRRITNSNPDWKIKTQQQMTNMNILIDNLMSDKQKKKEISKKINKHCQTKMIKAKDKKSKFKHLTKDDENYKFERKIYMNKLNRLDVSTIFQTRTRMLKVKANYKKMYKNEVVCRACKSEIETQKHVLQHCDALHDTNDTRISYEKIFEENDMKVLKEIAPKIRAAMEKLTKID